MRRLSPLLRVLVLTAVSLVHPQVVHAQAPAFGISLVGQDRRVAGSTFVTNGDVFDSDGQQLVAPDGGPFDVSVLADAAIEGAVGHAGSSQTSAILEHGIDASGAFDVSSSVTAEGAVAYASSETNVALRFIVPEAATYLLEGFIEASGTASTSVQFSRPFLTVEWASTTSEHIELSESGSIDAGTYDLNVTSHGVANSDPSIAEEQATGGYDLRLIFGSATGAPVVVAREIEAFPNPFTTRTRLVLPEHVGRVRIFDLAGRSVRTLEGAADLTWDGRDDAGHALANGVYWVRADDVSTAPLKVVRVR